MRIGPFDTFLAGALLFLSGLSFAFLMTDGPWERHDWHWLIACVAFLVAGAHRLQQLYRAQSERESARPEQPG